MPTVKEHVRNLLDDLPDTISWKQLRHEIWAMEQIEKGFAELDRGETVPHEQVLKETFGWLSESTGPKKLKKTSLKYSRGSRLLEPALVSESRGKYSKKSS